MIVEPRRVHGRRLGRLLFVLLALVAVVASGTTTAEAAKKKGKKKPKVEKVTAPFDKEAAFAALSAVDVSGKKFRLD